MDSEVPVDAPQVGTPEMPVPLPETSAANTPNGVLVVSKTGPQGGIEVDVQVVGDTRITEVDTLLRVAIRVIRQRLDLN